MSRFLRYLLILLVLTVASSAIALGRWQLRRLSARKAANATALTARALPPDTLGGGAGGGSTVIGRRVVAKGVFDTTRQILLRGRVQDESPGLEVVTPMTLMSGGGVLWVIRGFVRSPDAATPPAIIAAPDTGVVAVVGLATEVLAKPDSGKPLLRGTATSWSRLDAGAMHQLESTSLPFALQLAGDSNGPGRLATIPVPELTDGPHLSYAIQWFGIALAVAVFGIMFLRPSGPGFVPPPRAP